MLSLPRRYISAGAIILIFLFFTGLFYSRGDGYSLSNHFGSSTSSSRSSWSRRKERYPIQNFKRIPKGSPLKFPNIQASFPEESREARAKRRNRLVAVKQSFYHSWTGYRKYAWLADELLPVSGGKTEHFAGWAATLVDSLDTLWIMELHKEFDAAVQAVADIDFESSTADTIHVFETNIRYLGGLLSAYELSGRKVLLVKALQLGHMLYAAFDTPSRMPIPYFNWKNARDGGEQDTINHEISADIGSLCMEFTKLSQLTGDMRFYDATQRITELFAEQQDLSRIPGLWPVFVDPLTQDFASGVEFSLGAMADSLYEYLPKMHILLGGLQPEYETMYAKVVKAAREHLFFRPMNKNNEDILISGVSRFNGNGFTLDTSGQHLACFVGGMLGMGARLYERPEDLETAQKLANGCYWAYDVMKSGIMPETIVAVQCLDVRTCDWDEAVWHKNVQDRAGLPDEMDIRQYIDQNNIPPGFAGIADGRYILRPEAIESLFYMYRITGDIQWQDKAWKMYLAIEKATRAQHGYSAVENVASEKLKQVDSMESFWTAETLKYLYLIFSEPDVIDLDEWVLNTEAHPFRRLLPKKSWW